MCTYDSCLLPNLRPYLKKRKSNILKRHSSILKIWCIWTLSINLPESSRFEWSVLVVYVNIYTLYD